VAFAVSRSASDNRVVIRHTGLLRRLRDVVEVRPQRDDRLPRSPRGRPAGRDTGDGAVNLEAVFFQDVGEVLRGFEFLVAKLGVAEDLVDHLLSELAHGIDVDGHRSLHGVQFRIRRRRALPGAHSSDERGDERSNDNRSYVRGGHSSSPSMSSSTMSTTTL
jgi:hypothetical protein